MDGELQSDSANYTHQFSEYGLHQILVEVDTSGCLFSENQEIELKEVHVPNIFTPNNDGTNDNYVIRGIDDTGKWKFEVHNRWGKLIYDTQSYDNTWDGANLEDGTYYYLLTAPDETYCKGWVQIIR